MENKINIVELLKDCPKGTKLYSPLVGECTLEHIHGELKKILISTSDGTTLTFNHNGTYFQMDNSECLLFPSKDQRDWSKFQRPFKDGDVVTWEDRGSLVACIYKERKDIATFNHHIALYKYGWGITVNGEIALTDDEICFATEEEKEKLFQAIKDNGYKWNAETKTLEKLPKFKIGDKIKKKGNNDYRLTTIESINNNYYVIKTPDWFDNCYITDKLYFSNQDNYELVPSKFDITTLKPFDSRVLVRDANCYEWEADIFGRYSDGYITLGGGKWKQCIPYKCNEQLLGTTDDCDNYYKNW